MPARRSGPRRPQPCRASPRRIRAPARWLYGRFAGRAPEHPAREPLCRPGASSPTPEAKARLSSWTFTLARESSGFVVDVKQDPFGDTSGCLVRMLAQQTAIQRQESGLDDRRRGLIVNLIERMVLGHVPGDTPRAVCQVCCLSVAIGEACDEPLGTVGNRGSQRRGDLVAG